MASTRGAQKQDAAAMLMEARECVEETAIEEDMATARANPQYPEIGTSARCVQRAVDAIKRSNRTYKRTVIMMGPSMQTLAEANKRARHALERLRALPRQPDANEIAEQVAMRTLEFQVKATDAMLNAPRVADGAMPRQARRKGQGHAVLKTDFRKHHPNGPAPKMEVIDADGYAAMIEEGGRRGTTATRRQGCRGVGKSRASHCGRTARVRRRTAGSRKRRPTARGSSRGPALSHERLGRRAGTFAPRARAWRTGA